jgi:hypothetical protein
VFIPVPIASAAGDGLIGNWSPGIGDPSVAGWITVLAYLMAAWRCAVAAGRTVPYDGAAAQRERGLWRTFAVVLLLLGINKQLDLQSAFTELGRMVARRQHWYDERREVQMVFVVVVAALGVAAALGAAWAARGTSPAARLAVVGVALVAVFVVLRAASFHHVDVLLQSRWLGVKANQAVELSGISVVLAAAWLRRPAPPPGVAT